MGVNVTPDTWLISDTHFGHKNIIKYCNRPMNHNELMIRAWHELVQPDDTVLHLGDLAVWYGEKKEYWHQVASELPGKKYLLDSGNHDRDKPKVYASYGFTVIPDFIQEIKGQRVLFSHWPNVDRTGSWDINVHGHIHNNPLDYALASSGRRYKNISVEQTDYKPIRAKDILVFA